MANSRIRRLLFLIGVYVALPSALISAMLVGWMVAVENATLVLQSSDSFDGRYRAEVVREDPGVSSGYEYMVRVMPAGLTPLAKSLRMLPFGPVYIALDARREPEKLIVQWTGAETVTIHCEGCGETPPGGQKWRDISIKFDLR
jgi:hypothetical protein